jgi:hypothetical protein
VYLGLEGLRGFWHVENLGPNEDPGTIIHVPQLIDPDLFNQAVDLGQSGSEFELDCLAVPARIGAKGTRPRWPHMLIVAEAESSAIVGFELLQAVDGLPAMWSKIPGKLLSIISKSSARPAAIWVRSTLYLELLRPLSNALEIDIAKRSDLPAIEEVRESLFETSISRIWIQNGLSLFSKNSMLRWGPSRQLTMNS